MSECLPFHSLCPLHYLGVDVGCLLHSFFSCSQTFSLYISRSTQSVHHLFGLSIFVSDARLISLTSLVFHSPLCGCVSTMDSSNQCILKVLRLLVRAKMRLLYQPRHTSLQHCGIITESLLCRTIRRSQLFVCFQRFLYFGSLFLFGSIIYKTTLIGLLNLIVSAIYGTNAVCSTPLINWVLRNSSVSAEVRTITLCLVALNAGSMQ